MGLGINKHSAVKVVKGNESVFHIMTLLIVHC